MINYKKITYLLKTWFSCNNPIIIQEIYPEKGTGLITTRRARNTKFHIHRNKNLQKGFTTWKLCYLI